MKKLATALISLALATPLLAADEQTLWDAAKTAPTQWKTAQGISASVESDALVLRSKDADFGWAAADDSVPLQDGATLDVAVKEAKNGQLVVQIEWLKQDGSFLKAVDVLKEARTGAKIAARKLTDFLPEGEKPKKLRLKFWVEGKNAEVQIAKAVIRAPKAD